MRLSSERALAVAQVLVEHGLDWKQIRLVACGDEGLLKDGASIAIFKEGGRPVIVLSLKNAAANGFTFSDALLKMATRKN